MLGNTRPPAALAALRRGLDRLDGQCVVMDAARDRHLLHDPVPDLVGIGDLISLAVAGDEDRRDAVLDAGPGAPSGGRAGVLALAARENAGQILGESAPRT